MSNSETGILAIHVVASDAELAQIEAGGGEAASRRVAEALLFATSITMLKTTGQVDAPQLDVPIAQHHHYVICDLLCYCLICNSSLSPLPPLSMLTLPRSVLPLPRSVLPLPRCARAHVLWPLL